MLRDLFADPAPEAGKQYTNVLHGYLRSETTGPCRSAAWPPPTRTR
jgi:hypothetical protein